jgi:hypothetical protein
MTWHCIEGCCTPIAIGNIFVSRNNFVTDPVLPFWIRSPSAATACRSAIPMAPG